MGNFGVVYFTFLGLISSRMVSRFTFRLPLPVGSGCRVDGHNRYISGLGGIKSAMISVYLAHGAQGGTGESVSWNATYLSTRGRVQPSHFIGEEMDHYHFLPCVYLAPSKYFL